jgi:hypothetical protein
MFQTNRQQASAPRTSLSGESDQRRLRRHGEPTIEL